MEKKKARKPKRVTREVREEDAEAGGARAARETEESRKAPTEVESRPNESPPEREVFAGETEADLDAIIEGRLEERTSEESQAKHEEETKKQQELLDQEMQKKERKERLKRARNMRFRTGESETSIPKANERQQSSCLVDNLQNCSVSTARMPRNVVSAEDSEVDLLLTEDFDYDDDEEDVQQPPQQGADTIKAKMDFLKYFEIPSLSDISEDVDDATSADTVRPNYKYMENIEEGFEEYEEEDEGEEGEGEQDTLRSPAGLDSIRAKMNFLSRFAIPSISDISED